MPNYISETLLARYTLLPPVSKRKPYTTSRLAILDDGTTMPVLRILAREKFGEWDEREKFPFWIDKDWTHETLDNVELCAHSESDGQRPISSYGVPAGTQEYSRRWRAANTEKVKTSQRNYRRRRAEEHRRLRELERSGNVPTEDRSTLPPLSQTEEERRRDGQGSSVTEGLGDPSQAATASLLDKLEELIEPADPDGGGSAVPVPIDLEGRSVI
jgi:hypothetical protein